MDGVATGLRKIMQKVLNERPATQEELLTVFGPEDVFDTEQLKSSFEVCGFLAPMVIVIRKADGQRGTLLFQHHPRFYFSFTPEKQ